MRRVFACASSVALAAAVLSACGGGEQQDAAEPSGAYDVEVLEAQFAKSQKLARQTKMTLRVRNTGKSTVPNLAVTVRSFARRSDQPGLADPSRPVWILDRGPVNGENAYVDTYTAGPLRAGRTAEFTWLVTPVRAGRYELKWSVAAGLHGKARARGANGEPPRGEFAVNVSRTPASARVDPSTGAVIRE